MAAVNKEIKPVAVKVLQYNANVGEIEALLGCDAAHYEASVLTVTGKEAGSVIVAANKYIVAYAGTDYVAADPEADPPVEEVLYVPGVLIEVTDAAGITARYQDPS